MSGTTLTVRLGDGTETRQAAIERIEAAERGADLDEEHLLVFHDDADLQRLLSPANLQLLRAIRREEPESMREAAALVDRDFKEVHRNLTELEALNVIEFAEEGRSKRPIVRFDEIDVEVSLDVDPDGTPATA